MKAVEEDVMDPSDFNAPRVVIDTASFKKIQDWVALEIQRRRFDVLIQEIEPVNLQDLSAPTMRIRQTSKQQVSNFKISHSNNIGTVEVIQSNHSKSVDSQGGFNSEEGALVDISGPKLLGPILKK